MVLATGGSRSAREVRVPGSSTCLDVGYARGGVITDNLSDGPTRTEDLTIDPSVPTLREGQFDVLGANEIFYAARGDRRGA